VPSLFVVQGADQGKRIELRGKPASLGRDPANTLRLADGEVSRRHAELRPAAPGRYRVVDLGSANGTFLNGEPVDEAPLQPGDLLQVGGTTLLYAEDSRETAELTARVDLLAGAPAGDRSAIIRTASREDGSRLLADPAGASDWLREKLAHLAVLYQSTRAVSHIADLGQLLPRILELVFETIGADRGTILLADADGRLRPEAVRWRDAAAPEERLAVSHTIVEHVHRTGQGVVTTDAPGDVRFGPSDSIAGLAIREAICAPIQGRQGSLGVLYADALGSLERGGGAPPRPRFTQDHLTLMVAIGHQAGLAIENTRLLREKLQAERLAAVGEAIAILSHHIKNILQGLRSGGSLIELGLRGHDEDLIRRGWAIVEKNQDKVYHLVMDMLTYSKDREPALEPSDLNAVVAEVVELGRARAEELGVELRWSPDAEMPTIQIDPEAIQRAVLNVISNAIDACAEVPGARVEISTRWQPDPPTALIHIDDNGIGMAPEDVTGLFGLFASTKGTFGTGLGLPVSRKIVREHGGEIDVESQVGRGSRFTLRLPQVIGEPSPTPTASRAREAGTP
jgi:signal transduction histidine kinase